MRSPLALVLTLALLGSLPGVAQANSTYRSDAMKGPGETLEVVEVPEGMGDGAITERDLLALSEFFTFTYDEVGEFLGLNEMFEVELGDDAEDRMLGFWLYIWPSVDQTTKAQVSTFDKFWPAFRKEYAKISEDDKPVMIAALDGILDAVWGDFAIQTYAYLAGAYTHEEYGAMLASLLGAEQPEQVTESWDYWGSGEYWEGGGFVDDFAGYEGYAGYQEGYVDDGGGQMYYGRDNSISFGSTTSVDDMVGSTVIY